MIARLQRTAAGLRRAPLMRQFIGGFGLVVGAMLLGLVVGSTTLRGFDAADREAARR
jgi:hypothetical protein